MHCIAHKPRGRGGADLRRRLLATESAQCPKGKSGKESVIVDGWAEGPAIFASDSSSACDANKKYIERTVYDSRNARALAKIAQRTHDTLSRTRSPSEELDRLDKYVLSLRVPLWPPTPVLNSSKAKAALEKLDKPKKIPLLRSKQDISRPARPNTFLNRLFLTRLRSTWAPVEDNKAELRKEILAVGVARSLGTKHVRDAVNIVPEIIGAANELSGYTPPSPGTASHED